MEKIRIILVDDHKMFRDGLKSVLSDESNMIVTGEVGHASELQEKLQKQEVDLIITDITMPDISGIEMVRKIRSQYPDLKILFLSMHMKEEFIIKAIEVGADGYLPKDSGMNELLEAINTIASGGKYFNKDISDALLQSYISILKNKESRPEMQALTNREKEIVKLIVDGLSNTEIAEKLFISIRTVDSHKSNILQKLELKSTVDLVKYAIKNGIASID